MWVQQPPSCTFGCCCNKCRRWQQEGGRLQGRRVLGEWETRGDLWEEMEPSTERHRGRRWPCFDAARCHHPGVRAAAQRPAGCAARPCLGQEQRSASKGLDNPFCQISIFTMRQQSISVVLGLYSPNRNKTNQNKPDTHTPPPLKNLAGNSNV